LTEDFVFEVRAVLGTDQIELHGFNQTLANIDRGHRTILSADSWGFAAAVPASSHES
jgi:hypothetical protein